MNPSPVIAEHPARILIVDDERSTRQLLEVMLLAEGYRVLTAASGEEALALVAEQPPDLILLDILMPDMDGYQVAAKLKGNLATKHIPVIMVTALNDRNARMRGLDAGAEDFLTAPVDRAELCVRVRNLLRLKAYGDYHDKYSQMLKGEVGSRTAELAESEAAYRVLFERHPNPLWVYDLKTLAFLAVNEAAEHLYGYSRAEFLELTLEAIRPLDEVERLHAHRSKSEGGLVGDGEWRHRKKDGTMFDVDITGHTLTFAGRPAALVIARDITQRKSLEAQLLQAQKMEAVGQLAGGVAHDFNNLLTVILGSAELLLGTLARNHPEREEAEEIRKAALRAADLTRQLLAFSRQQVLAPQVLDLNESVANMGQILRRVIGEDIDLRTVASHDLWAVRADPGQLEQVVMNLAVNARDAMPAGGKLTIETANVELDDAYAREHGAVQPGYYVMLAVSDTGVGMEPEIRARIFEPFFTTKPKGKGTGLGLATVYGIVKQSGGYVWVYSEPGRGTTFKIYLPRVEDVAVPAKPTPPSTSSLRGSETILLVEDQEQVRQLVHRVLEAHGYAVLVAESGAEALQVAGAHAGPIHLLVTDVIMPGMSGREVGLLLAPARPETKVLYVSGYANESIVHHGVLEPGIAFLPKPFTVEALARKVREVLDTAESS